MKKIFLISIIILILLLIILGGVSWFLIQHQKNTTSVAVENSSDYVNQQYQFEVLLPQDWVGYSVVNGTWQGDAVSENGQTQLNSVQGPMISLRNPLWTQQHQYQDIPIMIFTLQQWADLEQGKFHIGAAPINPSQLAFNENYVFALPARYNFAYPDGWQEVDQIIKNNSVQAVKKVDVDSLPISSQILLCGGLASNSTQNVAADDSAFINLPSALYSDKNVQIKKASGNAAAKLTSSNMEPDSNDCWSDAYQFSGKGELDFDIKSTVANQPDYILIFMVGQTSNPGSAAGSVSITSVSPASGAVGTTVIIAGSGFTTDNTVLFDSLVAAKTQVSSVINGSQTITIAIPSSIAPDCKAGEACPDFVREVTPGMYTVAVQNQNGTSNTLDFTVTGNPIVP